MMNRWIEFFLFFIVIKFSIISPIDIQFPQNFLENVNEKLAELYNAEVSANFNYEVHKTVEYLNESQTATATVVNFIRQLTKDLKDMTVNGQNLLNVDEKLKRQIMRLPKLGYEALQDEDLEELQEAILKMSNFYKNVKLCAYKEPEICNLTLIPHVQDILHNTNDVDEIKYYWMEWRNKTGKSVKESFEKFIRMYQKTAKLNGFEKPSQMWYDNFDETDTIEKLDKVITSIRPLFEQFHARIRFLLQQKYGKELIKSSWPYPQHLSEIFIGNAFRYEENNGHIDFPFPQKSLPNITEVLIQKNYTMEKFFDLTSKFFTSIGMEEISKSSWIENALPVGHLERLILNCWNKVWHFYGRNDTTKITYCPNIDFSQFLNMYEILSELQYYRSFHGQPTLLQDEPLPNFIDAIGKVISMSVSTPKYLEKIGILPEGSSDDKEIRLNRLYLKGMQNILLLPILYILDKYRIDILDDDIKIWDNCEYWELTEKYTGAIPPEKRTNQEFDVPSKLLVAVDDEYSSHIISIIIQFQVYKSFCEKIDEYKKDDDRYPLDNCNLSDHPEIGKILKHAMSLGASKNWHEILEILTGQNYLDPSGFIEYFRPLYDWLIEDNRKNQVEIGWINVKLRIKLRKEVGNGSYDDFVLLDWPYVS